MDDPRCAFLHDESHVISENFSKRENYVSPKLTIINVKQAESGESGVPESDNGPAFAS